MKQIEKISSKKLTLDDIKSSLKEKNFEQAEEICNLIIKAEPNNSDALYFLGFIKKHLNQPSEGLSCISSAVSIAESKLGNWYIELGNIYCKEEKFDEALNLYKKALVVSPSSSCGVHNNIGIIYKKKNELDKAVECYKKALEIDSKNPAAYSNLALAIKEKGDFETAIELYKRAINLNPNFACAYYNWGLALKDQNKTEEAIPLIRKCLEIDPNFTDAFLDLAICLLVTGQLEEGWAYYEKRFAGLVEPKPKSNKPKWGSESIDGKKLYVLHEQGNGDTIQFARYIPLLKELGANVVFKPQKGLEKLFKQSDLKAEILDNYIADDSFDMYSLLLSLPHKLNTTKENIPSAGGYLKADETKIKEYKEKYFNTDKFKVGIFWQGSKTFKNDKNRSTTLSQFFPLGQFDNIQLYSLQKGHGEEQLQDLPENFNIIKLGETFEDFADTAAAIENLDLVITVDSAVGHLAGSLGKPVWMLSFFVWEWRWFMCTDKTPWYDSMKIFHQTESGNWSEVFDRVVEELKKTLSK